MVDKEILKKLKKIDIKSNRIAEEIFTGEYHSAFRGNGMEFDEIREYSLGDDIRNIDWNVTARQNKAYVKKFKEERELNFFLLIDMSYSTTYGDKKNMIAEIGATLAFSALKNNDKIGGMLFTDEVEKIVPAKKGKKHVLSIIESILEYNPKNRKTNIKNALEYFFRFEKKKSVVFIISDFLDIGYEDELKKLNMKHDIILIRIIDRSETLIPKGAIFSFKDLETGEEVVIDNTKRSLALSRPLKIFSKNTINVYTDIDFVKPLMLFFKKRMRR